MTVHQLQIELPGKNGNYSAESQNNPNDSSAIGPNSGSLVEGSGVTPNTSGSLSNGNTEQSLSFASGSGSTQVMLFVGFEFCCPFCSSDLS